MIDSCLRLQGYPVDLITVPCNSAAVFIADLQGHLKVPILNICEIAAAALAATHPEVERAAVLGGYVTYTKRTYEHHLRTHGIELVNHSSALQGEIEKLIERLKLGHANSTHVTEMHEILDQLHRELHAQAVILACTEFGCLPKFMSILPLIDSSRELAKHTVKVALATA
jgi:aspartate racemase